MTKGVANEMTAGANHIVTAPTIAHSVERLFRYCRQADWAGHDPYDALNSRVFARTPLAASKLARIAFTQVLKRLPFNVRPVLGISSHQNAKALGLFLSAAVRLRRCGIESDSAITALAVRLETSRSPGLPYWCWGYSFPWQTRTVLVPRGFPNIVCTVFAANALLDVYEDTGNPCYLSMARSAGEYLIHELFWSDGRMTAGFSYPLPGIHTKVHNANFLGAALLCRLFSACGDERLLTPALKVARYSAAKQRPDGSWYYGESRSQKWIDNFHTGYNLCALRDIGRYGKTTEFVDQVRLGYAFYRNHFVADSGAPRYYHDRTYPIDVHCAAQTIITLTSLGDLDPDSLGVADRVYAWTMRNMWDARGYFYYQVRRGWTNRIPYMRWSQSWMLLALAMLLEARRAAGGQSNGGAR